MDPRSFRHLWTPLTVGRTTLRNRVMLTGHTLLYGEGGLISDRHIAYFAERARGGVALIIIEQQAAHPAGRNYLAGCRAYDPACVARYAKLAEAIHGHGAKVFAQLFCGGAQGQGTQYIDEWRPLQAPSAVASTQFQELPAEMTAADIAAVIKGFAQSAEHARAGGLDGVEIHAAHSQLLGAFLSPAFNHRSDSYGGSVAARCRVVLEIGDAIRRRVGSELTLGLRLSVSEFLPGDAGITVEKTEQQVEIFSRSGLFDFYDISGGGYFAKHVSVTPMTSDLPQGFLAPQAKRIKLVAGNRAKIFVVGRVWDLSMAEEILAAGAADMVAMTRAHMADPFLLAKAQDGRAHEIVHCVGAMLCVRRLGEQNHVTCLVNPAMGREAQWGHGKLVPVAPSKAKRILVIGGGPAGLKAATRAAERGHSVSLIERRATLGGRLVQLAALPLRARWQVAIDDMRRDAERAGVALRTGHDAVAVDLDAAECLVLATGASWERSGFSAFRPERAAIPGSDQDNVIDIGTAIDHVILDPTSLGRKVVILDETQDALPAGLADLLAQAGTSVEILSPHLHFGDALARSYDLGFIMRRLTRLGITITPQHFVERISARVVHAYGIWDAKPRAIDDVDTLVMSLGRRPILALLKTPAARRAEPLRIGDALAPRTIEAVIYEGEKTGREV